MPISSLLKIWKKTNDLAHCSGPEQLKYSVTTYCSVMNWITTNYSLANWVLSNECNLRCDHRSTRGQLLRASKKDPPNHEHFMAYTLCEPPLKCRYSRLRRLLLKLQLDWPWIAEWAYVRWHFCCGCPISKPRQVLDFSSKKSGVDFFFNFFEKSKNELVRPKTAFLAILAKNWSFSDK